MNVSTTFVSLEKLDACQGVDWQEEESFPALYFEIMM